MNIFASIKKSFVVNKIARTLSKPIRSVADMMSSDDSKARERLFDLIEKQDDLRIILHKYEVGRTELEDILSKLIVTGAGQWKKGHFVPVSALVYPPPLDYCLRMYADDETDWIEVAYELIMYFEEGRMGEVVS